MIKVTLLNGFWENFNVNNIFFIGVITVCGLRYSIKLNRHTHAYTRSRSKSFALACRQAYLHSVSILELIDINLIKSNSDGDVKIKRRIERPDSCQPTVISWCRSPWRTRDLSQTPEILLNPAIYCFPSRKV